MGENESADNNIIFIHDFNTLSSPSSFSLLFSYVRCERRQGREGAAAASEDWTDLRLDSELLNRLTNKPHNFDHRRSSNNTAGPRCGWLGEWQIRRHGQCYHMYRL